MPDEGAPKPNNAEIKERKNFRILLAEDNDTARESLVQIFELLGYSSVVCVSNAEELEKKMLDPASKVDVILTDNNMSGKTGIEAIKFLRSLGDKTPAIVMTGRHGEKELMLEIERLGIVCLKKPFTMAEIELEIEKIRKKLK
jgi:CheY-like chemotaxis protein